MQATRANLLNNEAVLDYLINILLFSVHLALLAHHIEGLLDEACSSHSSVGYLLCQVLGVCKLACVCLLSERSLLVAGLEEATGVLRHRIEQVLVLFVRAITSVGIRR